MIFAAKGITSQMAPKTAVDNINNLLISTTENGCQDKNSLLDAYKLFDKNLSQTNVQRPVVLLADGHSSRFDFKVLDFLHEKQIHLFVSPPDTTGVTQLLDQSPNKQLHEQYNKMRDTLFSPFQTINREGFMTILGNMWNKWASKSNIEQAGARVGISKKGLNVNDMQQDKFSQAAAIMKEQGTPDNSVSFSSVVTRRAEKNKVAPSTPRSQSKAALQKGRYGSANYWKAMYEMSAENKQVPIEAGVKINEIKGLTTIHKVKPKEDDSNKKVRVTSVHGSMEGQNVRKRVKDLQTEKEEKIKRTEEKQEQKQQQKEMFYRCKIKCLCTGT